MTSSIRPAIAAIEFAITQGLEAATFLEAWLHGDFPEIRREWPGVPEDVFPAVEPVSEAALPGDAAATLTYTLSASSGYTCEGRRESVTPEHWKAIVAAIETPPRNTTTPVAAVDLDHTDMDRLREAASQSNWIPHEHYTIGDWVSDCCTFLREGPQASVGAPQRTIRLNANQLAAALEFVAPDYGRDLSQHTEEAVIADLPVGTFSDGEPRAAGLYCCLAECPDEGSILLEPGPAVGTGLARCIGCGCNDMHACEGGCYWLRVDYAAGVGVCSECKAHVKRWEAGDRTIASERE